MAKECRSVHMREGSVAALQLLCAPGQSANNLMAEFIERGIELRLNPPVPSFVAQEDLERLRAKVGELVEQNRALTDELQKVREDAQARQLVHVLELQAANKRADDHEQRAMELEQAVTTALADKVAAETLLNELNIPKLTGDLEATTKDLAITTGKLEQALSSIGELTRSLTTAKRELDEARLVPAESVTPTAYSKLLKQAHMLAGYLERAVILPQGIYDSLTRLVEGTGLLWRQRACILLDEGLERRHFYVPSGWMGEIIATLPTLPKLPPK